jgi:hypothetical protein
MGAVPCTGVDAQLSHGHDPRAAPAGGSHSRRVFANRYLDRASVHT